MELNAATRAADGRWRVYLPVLLAMLLGPAAGLEDRGGVGEAVRRETVEPHPPQGPRRIPGSGLDGRPLCLLDDARLKKEPWAPERPPSRRSLPRFHSPLARNLPRVTAVPATAPTLLDERLFGGAGNQVGMGIALGAEGVYVAGYATDEGLVAFYPFPLPASPAWSQQWPLGGNSEYFTSVSLGSDGVYVSGASNASGITVDGVGGHERKGVTVKYPRGGGPQIWQRQTPWPVAFPYSGEEGIYNSLAAVEGMSTFFYIAGASQAGGASGGRPYISKFDTSGNTLWTAGDATTGAFGEGRAVALLNGNVYLAGHSVWDGAHSAPYLRKFTTSGGLVWERKGSAYFGAGVYGAFYALVPLGGYLYAVGSRNDPATGAPRDFLVEKWDESGNRIWSRTHPWSGGTGLFYAAAAVGSRLFAAGYASPGPNMKDGVLGEIDTATGDLLSTTLYFGGTGNEQWNGMATDGVNLFLVGETTSSMQGGNVFGQFDFVLARYSLGTTPPPPPPPPVGSWIELAGSASMGGLSGTTSSSTHPSLVINSSGNPVVAWNEHLPAGVATYVKRWNGSAWVPYGNSGTGSGIRSLYDATPHTLSLALDAQGNPVVAWIQHPGGNADLYLKRWNPTTFEWEELGGSATGGGISNLPGHSQAPGVQVNSAGEPVVVWQEHENGAQFPEIYVKRWNGTSWVPYGPLASPGNVSQTGTGSYSPNLRLTRDGRPVVEWIDGSYPNHTIYLKAWDGNAWVELAGSASGGGISGNAQRNDGGTLALDSSDNPVVAWRRGFDTINLTSTAIMARRWIGSTWADYGGSSSGNGLSGPRGYTAAPSIAIDRSDNPIVSWEDRTVGDSEIYLRAWNSTSWLELDGSATGGGISNNSGGSISPSLASGSLGVAWQDDSSGNNEIYVKALFSAPVLTSIAVTPANPFLEVGQSVQFTATGTYSDGSSRTLTSGDGTWAPKVQMSTPGAGLSSGVLDGILYLAGGTGSPYSNTGTLQAYDPALDVWTPKTPMPTPRGGGTAAAVVGGLLYIIGGHDGSSGVGTVEAYNPTTNTWIATLSPMPTPRWHPMAGVANGKIYVMGGFNGSTTLNAVEEYDPATNTWRTGLAPLPTVRGTSVVATVNNLIYVVGGNDFNFYNATTARTVEAYNPATNTWTTGLPLMPAPRSSVVGALLDGLIYVVGGNDQAGTARHATVEAFDPLGNVWLSRPSMSTGRMTPGVGAIRGRLYVAGGSTSPFATGYVTTTEAFTPELIWSSSHPAVGTIDSSGLAAAVGLDTSTITATSGGVTGSTLLTVRDLTPPVFTSVPGPTTVEANTLDGSNVAPTPPTASDNLDPSPMITNNAPALLPLGTTTITWTATDASGNTSFVTTEVTVVDTTPPVFTLVPGPFLVEQENLSGTVVPIPMAAAMDIADASPVVTVNLPPGSVFPLGVSPVLFRATDGSGNYVDQVTTVTVVDTTPPQVAAPAPVVAEQTDRNGTPVAMPAPAVFDVCDAAPIVTSDAPATFPLGTTGVTFTVTDLSGNRTTGQTTVTVRDTTPPSFGGGAFETVTQIPLPGEGGRAALNPETGKLYVIDGLNGGAAWVIDTATNQLIKTIGTRGYDMDVAVNPRTNRIYVPQAFARVVRVIDGSTDTVLEDIPIPSPSNDIGWCAVDADTDRLFQAAANVVVVVDTRGVGGHPMTQFQSGLPWGHVLMGLNPSTRRLYATMSSALEVRVFHADTFALLGVIPLTHAGQLLAVNPVTDRVYVGTGGRVTVIDGASLSVVEVMSVGSVYPNGIAALATDPVGNRWFLAGNGQDPLAIYDGATNRLLSTLALPPGRVGGQGDLVYDDRSGRLYVSFETGSVVVLRGGAGTVAVVVEQTSQAGTAVSLTPPVATDVCDANVTVSSNSPATFPLGATTVTWTAADDSGNFTTTTQTVTVVDTTPPQVAAPAPVVAEQTNRNGTPVAMSAPAVFDLCDAAPIVTSDAPATFPLGTTTVTFTVRDISGNTSTVQTTVTVVDTTPPQLGAGGGDLAPWQGVGSFSGPRAFAMTATYNGYVYVLGGVFHSTWYSDVQYAPLNADGTVGPWVSSTSFSGGRSGHGAVAHNGFLYVLAGATAGAGYTDVQFARINADGSLGAWQNTTSLPEHVAAFGRVVANNRLYVVAGGGVNGAVPTVRFAPFNADGSLGNWVQTTSLPIAVGSLSAEVHDGRVYAIGGVNDGGPRNDVFSSAINLDGTLGPWQPLGGFTGPRFYHGSAILNGHLYVIGGQTGSIALADVQRAPLMADGSVGPWSATTPLPAPRLTHVPFAYQGRLYSLGGRDYTPPFFYSDGWVSTPAPGFSAITVEQAGPGGTAVTLTPPPATDVCDANVTVSSNAPAVFPLGETTVTWTAADDSGNVSTVTQTVTVLDTTPPQVAAPQSLVVEQTDRNGTPVAVPAPAVFDLCDAAPIVTSDAPATFPLGVTTVTIDVTDFSGNRTTVQTTVTVRDTTPPSFGGNEFETEASIPLPSSGGATGLNPVTGKVYVARGPNGGGALWVIDGTTNQVVKSLGTLGYDFDVAVNPRTNRIYVPQSFARAVRVIDGSTDSVIEDIPIPSPSNDIGGGVVDADTDRLFQAAANVVVVVDTRGVGGHPMTQFHSGLPWGHVLMALNPSTRRLYATMGSAQEVRIFHADTYALLGTIPLTHMAPWMALDAAANRVYVGSYSDARGRITVIDGATNQVARVIEAGSIYIAGLAADPVRGRLFVAGHGPEPRLAVYDGGTGQLLSTRTLAPQGRSVGDLAYNDRNGRLYVTYEQGVVEALREGGGTSSVVVEQASQAGTPVTLTPPAAIDLCDANVTLSSDAPAVFPLGATTVTWTAADDSGNVSTVTQTVTVVDTTPPQVAAPSPVVAEQTDRNGSPVAVPAPAVFDACDAAPMVTSDAPATFPLGTTTVTFTVTDLSGNTSTAQTTVTVVDTTAPVFGAESVTGITSWWRGEGDGTDSVGGHHGNLLNGTSFGPGRTGQAFRFDGVNDYIELPDENAFEFGGGPFSFAVWVKTSGNRGFNEHIFSKSNGWGSASEYVLYVNHVTGVAEFEHVWPNGTGFAPDNDLIGTTRIDDDAWHLIVVTSAGTGSGALKLYVDGVLENAQDGEFQSDGVAPLRIGSWAGGYTYNGFIDELQIYNRSLTAAEVAALHQGAVAGSLGSIVVEQTSPAGTAVALPVPAAMDVCDASVEVTSDAPAVFPLGVTTVTWTAADDSGNVSTVTQTVTVVDTTPPQVAAPAPVVAEQTNRNGTPVALTPPAATDVCDADVAVTGNPPAAFPLGTTSVTWTAADDSGNRTTVTQTVTVVDTTAPALVAPGPVVIEQTDRDGTPLAPSAGASRRPMPTARRALHAAAAGGKVYAVGGFINGDTPVVEEYDPANDTWRSVAPLPNVGGGNAGRYQGSIVELNGKLWMIGGWRTSPPLPTNTLQVYDPATNVWTQAAPHPTLTACSGAGVINGKIYVVTVCDGFSGYRKYLYVYDPATNGWTRLADIPRVHAGELAAVAGGKLYIIGGNDDTGAQLRDVDVYDPATNTWSVGAPMPTARVELAGGVIGGKIYAAGGFDGTQGVNVVEVYDPATNTWTTGTPLPSARWSMGGAVVGGQLFLVGGYDGAANVATLEALNPSGGALVAAATDVCDAAPLVTSDAPAAFPLGTTTVTFTATDGSGNRSTATTTVTVVDTTPPQVTAPPSMVVEQANLAGTPVAIPAPAVSDICDANPTVASDAPPTFPLGPTLVTFTVTDASGNVATASMTVMVVDSTPPVLSNVPAPVTVEQTSPAGASVSLAPPTASDLCDAAPTVTSDAPAVFALGTWVVTFTARDQSGNESTATTTVTVVDTTRPALSGVPAPVTVEQTSGAGTPVGLAPPSVVDICDTAPTLTSDAPAVFTLGTTVVTYTATDASGNSSTASTTVTVVDTTAPTLSNVPAPVTVLQTEAFGAAVGVPLPSAGDICDAGVAAMSDAPAVFPLGTTTVTFSATDASGNSAQAQTTVTVEIAPATALVVSGFPSPQTARVPGAFTVSAVNPFGTRDPRYQGTVGFSSSDPLAELPAPYAFKLADAGLMAFVATLHTPSTNHSITATDLANPSIAGSQPGIVLINLPPVADPQTVTLDEDTSAAIALTGSDAEGAPLTFTLTSAPTRGTLTGAAPNLVYAPFADLNGTDAFTFVVDDGVLVSAPATVTLVVRPVNDRPVATADAYVTDEDTPLNVPAPGVLANDSDIDGDALSAILVTAPANGVLALNSDGSFTYTPNPNFNGTDGFTYKANDGMLDSSPVTVALTINPVNDAPVAAGDAYFVDKNTPLTVPAPGVLSSDTDVEGDPLSAALAAGPATGTLAFTSDGSFLYTPENGFTGVVTFTYRSNDGAADSNVATVTLTVTPPNNPPKTKSDVYGAFRDTPIAVPASQGVLANDTDQDGDAMTALLVTGAANGTLVLNADGSFTYTPANGFTGADGFTYKASDGRSTSGVETVSITVSATNGAPDAKKDTYNDGVEDTPLAVPASQGVLANDTDPDANPLTAILVTPPTQGTLSLNPDGSFTYSPPAGFTGSVTFTYRANDGMANSGLATVTVKVKKK